MGISRFTKMVEAHYPCFGRSSLVFGRVLPSLGKLWSCLLALLLSAIAVFASAGSLAAQEIVNLQDAPIVRNFSKEEIGAGGPIWSIIEDGNTLFLGSDRLLIYDGAVWIQVPVSNTPEIRCMALHEDRVWIGGINEVGYFEKRSGSWTYVSVTSRIDAKLGIVWYAYAAQQSIVYVCSTKIIQLPLDGGSPRVWELPARSRLFAHAIAEGILICQPTDLQRNTLWLLRGDKLEKAPFSSPTLEYNWANDFLTDFGEKWIFNIQGKIFERDHRSGQERLLHDFADLGKLMTARGAYIDGVSYVGTIYGGMYVADESGSVLKCTKETGLPSDQCLAIVPSQLGGVWVGTDGGISFVLNPRIARSRTLLGTVHSITGGAKDLVIGSDQGLVRVLDGTARKSAERFFSAMQFGPETFVGGRNAIWSIDDKLTRTKVVDYAGSYIRSMVREDRDPDILFAANAVSLTRFDLATGQHTTVDVPDVPQRILRDSRGDLWLATFTGGVRVFDAELQRANVRVNTKQPTTLASHHGRPVVLVEKEGFLSDQNDRIPGSAGLTGLEGTISTDRNAWVYGLENGVPRLGEIRQENGTWRWVRRNVPGLRKMKNVEAIHLDGDTLYIGGDGVLMQVETQTLAEADLTLPAVVDFSTRDAKTKNTRTLFGAEGALPKSIELSTDEREINVTLQKKIWGPLEAPTYESRLLPAEDEWTAHEYGEPITRRNLPAGRYTLELRARHLGEAGQTTAFAFTRLPPWYFSHWGITLFAAMGVGAFYGTLKFRTRHILQRNRELEFKIHERTKELAKANSAKSEFLAAMSHEIRNPMNGVIGIVKMLQEAKLGAREKYLLTTLHRCAEQLRTTVDDVLDFSKIEAGEITLNPDTFDLAETINATISAMDITGERLELTSWAGARPTVVGDQGKLAQILTNYLSNALKYGMPPRATVDVFVLDESDRKCRVTLAVKNTGPDIPRDELAKLFESFQRGELAKARRIGGTGLGLAICKKYAEAMGGNVSATSEGGVTVFQLTLPFEKAGVAQSVADAALPIRLHARALAIEDEDYNRLVLGNILTKLGYQVDWAADGRTALQLVETNGYDLVLTDWMLPDTDGGTLTKKILQICEEPKPPIFAVTAYCTKEKQEECLKAGLAGFISKPVSLEKLQTALQAWGASRLVPIAPKTSDAQESSRNTSVSIQRLEELGALEAIIPDFSSRFIADWHTVEKLMREDRSKAADLAHRMISAALLVRADIASDQLRLMEKQLREGSSDADLEKLREVCGESVQDVVDSLLAILKKQQERSANGVRTPS